MFEPWHLAMIDAAGYNGIREEHIQKVARALLESGVKNIDRSTFERYCYSCGVNPSNFTQSDLNRLEAMLNK